MLLHLHSRCVSERFCRSRLTNIVLPGRFVKYNDLLRGFGGALEGCKGNRYVTTTHAINSAIIKASKLTRVAKVYRGVSGGTLPAEFWAADEHNVRGGCEYGFLSTTTDAAVATDYAASGGTAGTVFEIAMGERRRIRTRAPRPSPNPRLGLRLRPAEGEGSVSGPRVCAG